MEWISVSEKYEVSFEGHIRNKKTGRVLREFVGRGGYKRTQFDGVSRSVHRVVANAFLPRIEGKDYVNHIDGNKQNNRADNLEWCTRSENQRHAYNIGLICKLGEKNGRNKLTEDDVLFIRQNYKRGDAEYGVKALADKFGVSNQTISAVNSGQNWSWYKCGGTENDADNWRDFAVDYEVSSDGRVRHKKTKSVMKEYKNNKGAYVLLGSRNAIEMLHTKRVYVKDIIEKVFSKGDDVEI